MNIIFRLFISGFILLIIDWLLDSISIASYGTALLAVFLLSMMNLLVKPFLHLISLPITILTFGLFSFVINALTFYITAFFIEGFVISSFWGALIGSILLGFTQGLLTKRE